MQTYSRSKKIISHLLVIALFIFVQTGPAKAAITITDLHLETEGANVLVSWRTTEPGSGCVQFGLNKNYELQSCSTSGPRLDHDLLLTNLQPEALYHFRVVSKGAAGEVVSFDGTFETGKKSDLTKPEISQLNIEYVGTNNFYLTWETNEKTSGSVEYGFSSTDMNRRTGSGGKKLVHDTHIRGLTPGALYFYRVVAEDEDKNKAFSSIQSFRTATNEEIDESPLSISQVRPITPGDQQVGETTARISWRNSRPARGHVSFGVDPERLGKRESTEATRVFQEVLLENLRPGTTYYFRISMRDILNKSNDAPETDATYSFTSKSRVAVLGASSPNGTSVPANNQGFSRTPQPAVTTALSRSASQVLGAFTSIYTPATSLIKSLHTPRIYAIIKNQKHWLKSQEIFNSYGYQYGTVRIVSMAEIDSLRHATLAKLPDNPTVYYLYHDQNLKISIPSPAVFNSYAANKWENIVTLSVIDLESYAHARLVSLGPNSTIYLLENNRRRPFASQEALERFGFNINQVAFINEFHLNSFSLGESIN